MADDTLKLNLAPGKLELARGRKTLEVYPEELDDLLDKLGGAGNIVKAPTESVTWDIEAAK